ncbi:WbqC family protein [Streptomyces aquilus]|uniref:WbqC family protein n=1 Tax=Streptomyces aquilus TaxID=2548456 RepID=UPI0037CF0025
MTHTSASCGPASTAASSAPDLPPGRVCAIHQPNLFPRVSTLGKLYAADRWIVLDNVSFARRDYRHRARLAAPAGPDRQQWLTLPAHLPHGYPTLINQARLADPCRSHRVVSLLHRQFYGPSRHWPAMREVLDTVLDVHDGTELVSDVARSSTLPTAAQSRCVTVVRSDWPISRRLPVRYRWSAVPRQWPVC